MSDLSGTRETVGVQLISIVACNAPTVSRPPGTQTVYLTFEGLRDSRTIADKLTRVRVALPAAQARHLSDLLAVALPADDQSNR